MATMVPLSPLLMIRMRGALMMPPPQAPAGTGLVAEGGVVFNEKNSHPSVLWLARPQRRGSGDCARCRAARHVNDSIAFGERQSSVGRYFDVLLVADAIGRNDGCHACVPGYRPAVAGP